MSVRVCPRLHIVPPSIFSRLIVGSATVSGGPTGITTQTLAERWNGRAWIVVPTPTTGFMASEFGADTGLEGGAVSATPTVLFAVGSVVDLKNNTRTLAEAHAA